MNHVAVKLAIKDKTPEEQVAFLKDQGMPEDQIQDYLNWINQPSKQLEKKQEPTSFKESPFFKRIQAKFNLSEDFMNTSAPPEPGPEDGLSAFQKDILHNQYLMGGPCRDDRASFHNPDLQETMTLKWFRDEVAKSERPFALVVGGTGATKTWSSLAYVNSIARIDWKFEKVAYSNAAYVHAYKLSTMLQDPKAYRDELETLTRKQILLLDDLGTEPLGFKGSDFLAYLEFLVNERYRFNRRTIMTSNNTEEKFIEIYGQRIVSRIYEVGMFLETTDPDYRQQPAQQYQDNQ